METQQAAAPHLASDEETVVQRIQLLRLRQLVAGAHLPRAAAMACKWSWRLLPERCI